ncbi:MAG: flagellar FliJ family protein [Myxococcota bacterium]
MPVYRLQALYDIKERNEKDAKDAFGAAQQALREQQKLQKDMEDELKRMIEDRHRRREEYSQKLASGEMKVTDQSSAYRFIERLKEKEKEQEFKIEAQKENVRNAEKEVKRAQDALIVATQELKALQKHKEKWLADWKKEMAAKEEDNLDEIGQVIFNRKR